MIMLSKLLSWVHTISQSSCEAAVIVTSRVSRMLYVMPILINPSSRVVYWYMVTGKQQQ